MLTQRANGVFRDRLWDGPVTGSLLAIPICHSQEATMAEVTITVCTTCRRGLPDDPEAPRPGTRMLEALQAAGLPEGVALRPVECLSACSRGCTIALSGGPDRWTYVYGDLDPAEHVPEIVKGAAAYAGTEDGLVPWRERPVIFRKQSIARIPPQE
jgi:predicted metal-binding protein